MPSSLSPARRGYRYQDVVAALLLARGTILEPLVVAILDRKLHPCDRFDDVTLLVGASSIRRQIKSSVKLTPEWKVSDFTSDTRNLRLDLLVQSALTDDLFESTRYAASAPFAMSPEFQAFLIPADRLSPSLSAAVQTWRLDVEKLWPEGATPLWNVLREVKRADFERFADQFFIESHLPDASLDLDMPGPLERALFQVVSDEIGIGVYPNRDRRVEDVAAALIDIANQIGVTGGEINAATVLRRLAIQTDYGRVAQQFPIIQKALVERTTLIDKFTAALMHAGTALIGPPGSGKSWLITEAADALTEMGALVARHYCYLEPGDEKVQRRITTDALFANLIAELVDREPTLADAVRPRFASGARELEGVLAAAAEADPDRPIVLLIDGLDHIARVAETASSIARDDTAIVDELALLSIPSTVRLVVASQPGAHLDPLLDGVTQFAMPAWSEGEIALLATNCGVPQAMKEAGFDEDDILGTLAALTERADGNPLYATFLCRTILNRLQDDATSPLEVLSDAPRIEGDVSRYYASLLPPSEHVARAVADVLAFVDFGLTADELRTIFPLNAPYVDAALKRLRPTLHIVTSQGGVRLYHESLRRFIVTELGEDPRNAAARILPPVILWLENAGLFESSRTYRFLLPLLARMGAMTEVATHVAPNFVERSVAHGHAPKAIQSNLVLAVNSAAEMGDWPSVVRAIQLERARRTYAMRMEHAQLLSRYGKAFVALFGAAALNERLMFDGKPTLDRAGGIVWCSLGDDAGETPPWREYLRLRRDEEDSDSSGSEELNDEATFHGLLGTDPDGALSSLLEWLANGEVAPRFAHAFTLIRRAVGVLGAEAVLAGGATLHGAALVVLTLGVVEAVPSAGASRSAALLAGLRIADCPKSLLDRFADLSGRHSEAYELATDVNSVLGVVPDGRRFGATETAAWLAAVRLAARVAPDQLPSVEAKLAGGGWGHAWLRFSISIAKAESLADQSTRDTAIITALETLRDTESHPDPFSIVDVAPAIHATLRCALAQIVSLEAFGEVVKILTTFSQSTQSHFQGNSIGALLTEDFLDLLAPYVADASRAAICLEAMRARVDATETYGEFYETHAEHDLQLVALYATYGRKDEALERWTRAATNLTAYGWRRDSTAFELMESLEIIAETAPYEARMRLVEMQSVAENVVEHTDGKDTKWIIPYWFKALRIADPAGAMELLARSIPPSDGGIDWRIEEAYDDVANHVGTMGVHPLIATHLQAAARATAELNDTTARVRVFEDLAALGLDPAPLVMVLAAAMAGDATSVTADAINMLTNFAADRGISLPLILPRANPTHSAPTPATRRPESPSEPLPDTVRELVLAIHTGRFEFRGDPSAVENFANNLGFRLLGLGDEIAAIRLMRVFARASFYNDADAVLSALGEGFARFQAPKLASTAFALAYIYAKPNWSIFGTRNARSRFVTAASIDSDIAHSLLRAEAAFFFAKYGGSDGLTQHPIELFAMLGDIEGALRTWDAAISVMRRRLPLATQGRRAFVTYDAAKIVPSINEAAAQVLVARAFHPEHERKRAALAGIAEIVAAGEESIVPALREALESGALTTRLAILNILDCLEEEATWCTRAMKTAIRTAAGDEYFGVRITATNLLARIRDAAHLPETRGITVPEHSLSPDRIAAFVSVDPRAAALDRFLPGYGRMFAGLLDEALRDQDRKQRIRARSSMFIDSARERYPENILFEHQEIVEEALHRAASALIDDTRTAAVQQVAHFLSLRIERHVTHWFSRTARPPSLLRPTNRTTGRTSPKPLTDPVYPGWYRIGYYEREYVREEKVVLGRLTRKRIAMSGLQLHPGGSPNLSTCLVNGNDLQFDTRILTTALHADRTALGYVHLLMPTTALLRRFALVPGSWRAPLVAHDAGGVACVFRQWREEPLGDDLSCEEPVLRGCDLLLRPDLYHALYEDAAGWISDVVIIAEVDMEGSDHSQAKSL